MNFNFAVVPGAHYENEFFPEMMLCETIHQAYARALCMFEDGNPDYIMIGEILDDGSVHNAIRYRRQEIIDLVMK